MLLELLEKRRSIRKFKDEKLKKEDIEKMIKGALLAPSSRANKNWEFIAVDDKNIIEKLSLSKLSGSQFLKEAPFAFVILGNSNLSDVWIEDCSIVATIVQLLAEDLGYGSCWIQIRNRMHSEIKSSEDYVKEILNIDKNLAVEAIIAIGVPDETKEFYKDSDFDYNKVHYNEYKKR